jgi:hypothetical protein
VERLQGETNVKVDNGNYRGPHRLWYDFNGLGNLLSYNGVDHIGRHSTENDRN